MPSLAGTLGDPPEGCLLATPQNAIPPQAVEGNGRLWPLAPGRLMDKLMQLR